MADYIYLLDHRLSGAQREALRIVRELARSRNLTVFLVGGAVRDLTSGSPVRDLDVVVQGNALKLRKDLESAGATVTGHNEPGQALFLSFSGSVRMELGSTLSVTYPKPGKPVYKPSNVLDDLHRRDFTANAMALSLNEGSYGLLMDPLNGVADIENRELRLVSNYGFIEDPVRMIRAARFMARLGWSMDEKTQQRYETGKEEDYISALSPFSSGYELEEIVHEEDPLRVLKRLEAENWMKHLAPYWTSAKVNVPELEHVREIQTKLQMQGIHPDPSAVNFPLLTAKLTPKEIATLKATFPRQGFVQDVDSLDAKAKELGAQLTGKAAALPSQAWKIITSAPPEVVLATMFSTRSSALQAKFASFTGVWPQARQKMPYQLMQEMRIVPELPGYDELLEKLFFELMDDRLQTPEEMKAFLEPYSPPAPPPPVNMRRARATKKDAKSAKTRAKKAAATIEDGDEDEGSDLLDEGIAEALDLPDGDTESAEPPMEETQGTHEEPEETEHEEEEEEEEKERPASRVASHAARPPRTAAKPAPAPAKVVTPAKAVASATHAPKAKAQKDQPQKAHAKPVAVPATKSSPGKQAIAPAKKPAGRSPAKKAVPPVKPPSKTAAKASGRQAPPPARRAVAAPPPAKKVAHKAAPPARKTVPPAKKTASKAHPAKAPAKKASSSANASKKSVPAKKHR